ncbi:hypothetical protein IMY05_C4680000600 [Salix suchowensis]|nr:hypothetical protein IMY05_C4680000600 [Salix suchowensis]
MIVGAMKTLEVFLRNPDEEDENYKPHPSMKHLFLMSGLPEVMESLLGNRNVSDWVAHSDVYCAMLSTLKCMSNSERRNRELDAGHGKITWESSSGKDSIARSPPVYEAVKGLERHRRPLLELARGSSFQRRTILVLYQLTALRYANSNGIATTLWYSASCRGTPPFKEAFTFRGIVPRYDEPLLVWYETHEGRQCYLQHIDKLLMQSAERRDAPTHRLSPRYFNSWKIADAGMDMDREIGCDYLWLWAKWSYATPRHARQRRAGPRLVEFALYDILDGCITATMESPERPHV